MFSKKELIEAIERVENTWLNFMVHDYLIGIWNRKTKKIIKDIAELNEKSVQALKNGNYSRYAQLEKEADALEKKLDKLFNG